MKKILESTIFKIIAIAIAVILIATTAIVVISNARKNIFDYVNITFDGYDGRGKVNVELNETALIEDFISKKYDDAYLAYTVYDELVSGMDYEIEYEDGLSNGILSNGDEITISFTFTDSSAEKFKDTSKTFTVSELTEVEKVEVFDYVDITFVGASGSGYFDYKITTDDKFVNYMDFDLTYDSAENGELKNGDTITLTVNCNDWVIEDYLKAPATPSKSYTVSGLPTIMTASDITPDMVASVKNYFENNLDEYIPSPISAFSTTYSDIQYHSAYYYDCKDEYRSDYNVSCLYLYYTATKDAAFEDPYPVVIAIRVDGNHETNGYYYYDLVKFSDGTNNLNPEYLSIDYMKSSSVDEVVKDGVTQNDIEKWTATKVG